MNMHRTILFLLALAAPTSTLAQTTLELSFKGRVEPLARVQVANQVTGVVSDVHFKPGQSIHRGELMYSMDRSGFEIDVQAAKAALAEAQARYALATDSADRQAELLSRGTGPEAKAVETKLQAEIAKAGVAHAEAALAAAELALARTQIVAPISGVARSKISAGAFVETKGGTALGEIVQTDPILVAYQVPYADRQRALKSAGTTSVKGLFPKIKLSLQLPSGEIYAYPGEPKFESAHLDEKTAMLTTWGEFPNPDGVLIPGLDVTVISEIAGASPATAPSSN